MYTQSIPHTLKQLRLTHNLTQVSLSKMLGCTTASYCRYENGDRELPVNVLIKLIEVYDISIDKIVGRECDDRVEFVSFDYIARRARAGSGSGVDKSAGVDKNQYTNQRNVDIVLGKCYKNSGPG